MTRSNGLVLALMAVAVTGIAGCSGMAPVQEKSATQIVSERAKVRWQHLIKGDIGSAYAYASPAYRSSNSEQQFRAGFKPGLWQGAEVKSVTCQEADVCRVELEIEYRFVAKMSGPVAGRQILTETWRKDAGEWWYVPDMR